MKIIPPAGDRLLRGFLIAILLAGGFGIAGSPRLSAQETPECLLPDAIPYLLRMPAPAASPVASADASPIASPMASLAASPIATPAASPIASPIASPVSSPEAVPPATPVIDEATEAHVRDIVNAITGCETIGDWETVLRLVTADYLEARYGVPISFKEFPSFAEKLPLIPIRAETIEITGADASGNIRAIVDLVFANQALRTEWTFSWKELRKWEGDTPLGRWRADSYLLLETPAPKKAAKIDVAIDSKGFELDRTKVKHTDVVITGSNTDTVDHELLVVRIEPWQTAEILLTSPGVAFPDGVTFIGQLSIPAGTSGGLVLVDLPPGDYTIVDQLPDSGGVSHLAKGYLAVFTVTG